MISLLDELYITALLRLKFESFEKLTGKKGKSDALYKFSKSKKDRNSKTALKQSIPLHNYTRNLMIAFVKVI